MKNNVAKKEERDSIEYMTESGFLTLTEKAYLRNYMNRRKASGLCVRRANALLALDKGYTDEEVCDFLEIGSTTLRGWLKSYEEQGLSFLEMNPYSVREGHLTFPQESELKSYLRENPMRDTNEIRFHILSTYGQNYSVSGCGKLLHRLGFEYKKPVKLSASANEQEQSNFMEIYEKLRDVLPEDEIIYFGDAVHPDHQVRPAYGWFHKEDSPAVRTNSGRKRVNIHGALCLENADCSFVEVETVNADSTIALFEKLEAQNPNKRVIHVILDNAKYHHAVKVRDWLSQNNCKINIIWLPSYAPHLNSIERLWGVMHQYVTHNKFYRTYKEFKQAITDFLTQTIPKEWETIKSSVTDNFRIITSENCKIISDIR